jgi:hypothetical protein
MNDRSERPQPTTDPGLCGTCRHARKVTSDRGRQFVRCSLAGVDPRFAKYPSLPVWTCEGYAVTEVG